MRHVVGAVDPQGVDAHVVQGADPRGARARLPVAGPQGAAGAGDDRRLRPVALRGRAVVRVHDLVPRHDLAAALRDDQPVRAVAGRRAAPPSSRCMLHISRDEQKDRLWPSASTARTSTGSTTPATSTSGPAGTDYQEAYDDALEPLLDATRRRGTSCPPTASGTPVGRAAAADRAASSAIDPQWPEADFDVEVEKGRLAAT